MTKMMTQESVSLELQREMRQECHQPPRGDTVRKGVPPTPRVEHPPSSQEARNPPRAFLGPEDTSWHMAAVGWGQR